MALQVGAINLSQEDYGTYILFGLPQGETKLADIISEIDEEVLKMQTDLISEKAYQHRSILSSLTRYEFGLILPQMLS